VKKKYLSKFAIMVFWISSAFQGTGPPTETPAGPPLDNSLLVGGTFIVASFYAEFSKSAAIPIVFAILAVESTSWQQWWMMVLILLAATLFTRFLRAVKS